MRIRKKITAITSGIIALTCLTGAVAFADGPFTFSFNIKDATIGYSTLPYRKSSGTAVTTIQLTKMTKDWPWYQNKSVNVLVAMDATQLTDNVKLSTQIEGIPSGVTLNYIYNGNYYGWLDGDVCLRANSTETDTGFTVTGTWIPNAGTSYK